LDIVVHAYHPSNGQKLKIESKSRLAWAKCETLYQNSWSKKGWRHGSNGRDHASQVQTPVPKKKKISSTEIYEFQKDETKQKLRIQ
jgi:hypothetical protein